MTNSLNLMVEEELRPPELSLADKDKAKRVVKELSRLVLDEETCLRIKKIFREEMVKGLRSESSSLQMANTYLSEIPDGKEDGKFLALDLGGTNFRVLLVEFESGRMTDVQSQLYHIGEVLRLGDGRDLFDYLADCVCDFIERKQLTGQCLPLGFTFSFPMEQESLKSARLVKWTKSFNCSGVEGEDVVTLLNEAFCRRECCDVSVHAVLNDTTGTLMMGAFMDRGTSIGLILGTGCNACYLERATNVKNREPKQDGEEIVIDIEWGAFGDNGVLTFIQTDYDEEVDKNSLLYKSFTFEKYISGNYLGEIVRCVLVSLVKKGLLFTGNLTTILDTPGSFTSAMVSTVEECTISNNREDILHVIESLGVRNCTTDDLSVVQYVCTLVSNRSALLVSICLADLLDWLDRSATTIAVDGSLYMKHPRYQLQMQKYVGLFTEKKFKLMEVEDGSGRGAALVAAAAMRQEGKSESS